jgi:hypothetical protein
MYKPKQKGKKKFNNIKPGKKRRNGESDVDAAEAGAGVGTEKKNVKCTSMYREEVDRRVPVYAPRARTRARIPNTRPAKKKKKNKKFFFDHHIA